MPADLEYMELALEQVQRGLSLLTAGLVLLLVAVGCLYLWVAHHS